MAKITKKKQVEIKEDILEALEEVNTPENQEIIQSILDLSEEINIEKEENDDKIKLDTSKPITKTNVFSRLRKKTIFTTTKEIDENGNEKIVIRKKG